MLQVGYQNDDKEIVVLHGLDALSCSLLVAFAIVVVVAVAVFVIRDSFHTQNLYMPFSGWHSLSLQCVPNPGLQFVSLCTISLL